jgi:DNA repair protein RadC
MTEPAFTSENRLRSTVLGERPQERMETYGASVLSDTELLTLLLRNGTQGMDVLSLAAGMITEAGSLAGLLGWKENDFRRFKGIGHVKALQLVAVMEVVRRVFVQQQGEAPLLNRPELILS